MKGKRKGNKIILDFANADFPYGVNLEQTLDAFLAELQRDMRERLRDAWGSSWQPGDYSYYFHQGETLSMVLKDKDRLVQVLKDGDSWFAVYETQKGT